eukprot:4073126-Amphidinium_carterae.1
MSFNCFGGWGVSRGREQHSTSDGFWESCFGVVGFPRREPWHGVHRAMLGMESTPFGIVVWALRIVNPEPPEPLKFMTCMTP